MTNEERAKEIAKETLSDLATSFLGWIDEMSEFFCKESAKRMANWKDQQIKRYLKKKKAIADVNINECYKNGYDSTRDEIVSDFLSEIIDELFPEKN